MHPCVYEVYQPIMVQRPGSPTCQIHRPAISPHHTTILHKKDLAAIIDVTLTSCFINHPCVFLFHFISEGEKYATSNLWTVANNVHALYHIRAFPHKACFVASVANEHNDIGNSRIAAPSGAHMEHQLTPVFWDTGQGFHPIPTSQQCPTISQNCFSTQTSVSS